MTYEILLRILNAKNPEALLLEPRNIYDPCVVDITNKPEDHWNRIKGILGTSLRFAVLQEWPEPPCLPPWAP